MLFAAFSMVLAAVNCVFAVRSVVIASRSRKWTLDANAEASAVDGAVSIVVPARDEERQIEQCVRSLLAQTGSRFEIIVVDDRSDDSTASIVERIAREDARLRLVHGKPLPEGWVGKPWALVQGAAHATGEWIIFTDADTTHGPRAASAAIAYAQRRGIDVLSLLTDQTMITPAERLLLPSILWTILFGTGSLSAINDPSSDAALFNGQYIAMSRRAHTAIGGHAMVANEIAEDLELCRRLKKDGRFRVALVGAPGLVQTRMYRSFGEIWNGFVKNFALGSRGRPLDAAIGVTFLVLLAPVTPLAFVAAIATGRWTAAALLGGAMTLAIGGAEYGMRQARFPRWSALALPAGMTVMVAIFATSVLKHSRGGVTWRGRRY